MVIKEGGEYVLYYDHWCANTLDAELFWGPDVARAFIAQRDPVGDDHWLDDVWCEGAALLDIDTKTLTFFGGEDMNYDAAYRNAGLAMLRKAWPGWQVNWAYRGLIDIAEPLGIDPEVIRVTSKPDVPIDVGQEADWNDMLVTIKRNGECFAAMAIANIEALTAGPSALDLSVLETSKIKTWPHEHPDCGIHVDFDQRHLAWWQSQPSNLAPDIAAAWTGWQTTWLKDDASAQIQASGLDLDLPSQSIVDIQTDILSRLERQLDIVPKNYALDSAQRLAEQGHKVELSAATNEFRPQAPLDIVDKQRIISNFRDQIPITD